LAQLAFADALHFRRMQAVEFVAVLRLLLEQALDFLQQIGNLGLEVLRYLGQLAKYVTPDAAN
jgi:hypothetical protein